MEKIQVKSINEGITSKKQVPINLMMKNRLGAKWFLIILLCFIFGGTGGILADHYLFPYLVSLPQFEKYKFLKPKGVVVVKKEETKKVEEKNIVPDLVKKIRPYVVGIAESEDLNNFLSRTSSSLKHGGQGVILTSDGIILTTRQVIPKSSSYTIVFEDGKNYETNKIIFDPASDLVFLKIKIDNLPAVTLGNLDDLSLSQKVLIFKNLFLEKSYNLTVGTIENTHKMETFSVQNEDLDSFVQIEANLDKFSFGAPVFDSSGKMIGINNKVNNKTSLMIAAEDIKKPLSDIIKNEKIKRVKLGIKYFNLTSDFAYFKNLKKISGVYLPQYMIKDAIERGGPAEKAGIMPGDLIYEIFGKEISGQETYFRLLAQKDKGEKIEISYLRKEKEYKTEAVLKEREIEDNNVHP